MFEVRTPLYFYISIYKSETLTAYEWNQARNLREAIKAMADVAPQFGLVPLQKISCPEATVALMSQMTLSF